MADLEVSDSELNTKILPRIKADIEHVADEHRKAQKLLEDTQTKISQQGMKTALEFELKREIRTRDFVGRRLNFVVTVIAVCIEDLTKISRDRPYIIAVKDLLRSTENFNDETSIKALRAALVVIEDCDYSSCTDSYADLERTFKSSPEERSLKQHSSLSGSFP